MFDLYLFIKKPEG